MPVVPEFSDEQIDYFMQVALNEAGLAAAAGEVPVGAVVVYRNQIIAQAHNLRETDQLAIAHAELLAITSANQAIGSWRLEETALFVTLEPCMMCSGAIINARVPVVYYGASDAKGGTVDSLYQLLGDERLNHQAVVHQGARGHEGAERLQTFFREIRQWRKQARMK